MTFQLPWSNPLVAHEASSLARYLCEYACNGSRGRPEKGDPVYDAVTEGRDFGAGYSSCADLAHWLLFRLGVRSKLVNRKEHQGWVSGVNVARLAWCQYAHVPNANDRFSSGDILVVWNLPDGCDAHVTVVLRDGRIEDDEQALETANYGAPGGAIRTTPLRAGTILGKKRIQRWIPLFNLLEGAHEAGELVGAEDPTRTADGSLLWTVSPTVSPGPAGPVPASGRDQGAALSLRVESAAPI